MHSISDFDNPIDEYAGCYTTCSGSISPAVTNSRTCTMVVRAAMHMSGPKLRAARLYVRFPRRSALVCLDECDVARKGVLDHVRASVELVYLLCPLRAVCQRWLV